jgi:predicted nucleic acid-binding protein
MISRAYLDTAVLAYALGGAHAEREPSRAVLAAAAQGRLEVHVSVEVVQELLFHRMRRTGTAEAVAQARAAAAACVVHPFDGDVLELSSSLVLATPELRGRDAVHAATALHAGVPTLISPDPAFDAVVGITRVTAVEAVARLD